MDQLICFLCKNIIPKGSHEKCNDSSCQTHSDYFTSNIDLYDTNNVVPLCVDCYHNECEYVCFYCHGRCDLYGENMDFPPEKKPKRNNRTWFEGERVKNYPEFFCEKHLCKECNFILPHKWIKQDDELCYECENIVVV